MSIFKKSTKKQRVRRVRARVKGTDQQPRLSVFRSNQHIYAQIINDQQGKTLVSAHESQLKTKPDNRTAMAREIGKLIADKALKAKITQVKFDRGPYHYHGRIKALAEAAREAGLKF